MDEGMISVGTIKVGFFKADHNGGLPTAVIFEESENVDGARALREFCVAYGTVKSAVAIVKAFGGEVDTARAVTDSIDPIVRRSDLTSSDDDIVDRPAR